MGKISLLPSGKGSIEKVGVGRETYYIVKY